MPVITITRASCSTGELIAKEVADSLGYTSIGSSEVFSGAAVEFSVEEDKIKDALENPPSFFGMSYARMQKYLLCFQASLIHRLLQDNVIYYGPAGNFLIQGVSHVLNVYIKAAIEDRVQVKAQREHISPGEAVKCLLNNDKSRQKWARFVFKNEYDGIYDLCVVSQSQRHEQAVETIISEVKKRRYSITTYSRACLRNLALSCAVKAALIDLDPDVDIRTEGANVFVHTRACGREKEKRAGTVKRIAETIDGVEKVEVNVTENLFLQMANSYR